MWSHVHFSVNISQNFEFWRQRSCPSGTVPRLYTWQETVLQTHDCPSLLRSVSSLGGFPRKSGNKSRKERVLTPNEYSISLFSVLSNLLCRSKKFVQRNSTPQRREQVEYCHMRMASPNRNICCHQLSN